ncbi:acetyl-CoA carboxylase [Rhizobium sp. 18065]|uniref:acetyl-CoA carboxylase n=1 Tax=Rhizobium sp. 18065 TaxID=2681411 RepID=UPI00135B24FE|nr:acetyl-CoA carboxylase [Rhizobium sp. 18065]
MSAIDFSDPEIIAFLADALTSAGVDGVEISTASGQLRIVVSADGSTRTAVDRSVATIAIKASMAGIFCLQRPGSVDIVADLPRPVTATEVLGFLRVGPVLVPLTAGRTGLLTRRLTEPGALVGFGEALFEIEANP